MQFFLRNLDDANQRLAVYVLVEINDHVQTLVNSAHSLGHQSLLGWDSLTVEIDVLCSRDLSLLLKFLPIFLERNLVRVGERFVAALLFNARLEHATLLALVVYKGLNHYGLFKVLIISDLDRDLGAFCGSVFFKKELLVKAVSSLAAKDHLDAIFNAGDLRVEVNALVVNHEPTLVAHISLSQLFILIDSFLFTFVPCFVT